MPSNVDVVRDVRDELYWDPKVDNTAIAVSADGGKVTLRGTVGSLREKREAGAAAERVFGVVMVRNELQVRVLNDGRRGDAELRGDVLQALMLDSLVPATIDAKVADGFVTLTGTADWQYQRDEADRVVSNIVGALDIFDEIDLRHPDSDAVAIKGGIESALERSARLDGHRLRVKTAGGTVTIKGRVSSLAAHDEAIAAAWAAPGVKHVEDHIDVEY